MLNAVLLTVLVSLDPSLAARAVLLTPQLTAGEQAVAGAPDAGVAPEEAPAETAPGEQTSGAQEAPAVAAPASPAPVSADPAPASEEAPGTGATASDAAPPASPPAEPELKGMEEPELKGMETEAGKPWTGRVRYVWPFAKESELLPGDVRIPLPVWLMAVGGGAAVAAGIPFYTIARGAESRLNSGDDTIRTDADRAQVLNFGRTMEAWGVGLWATGGVLVAASWTVFYVLGVQEKPKGMNYSLQLGPQGGMVQLEWRLP